MGLSGKLSEKTLQKDYKNFSSAVNCLAAVGFFLRDIRKLT
jgi:hypothetical protein